MRAIQLDTATAVARILFQGGERFSSIPFLSPPIHNNTTTNNNKLPLLQTSQTAQLQQAVMQDSNEKSNPASVQVVTRGSHSFTSHPQTDHRFICTAQSQDNCRLYCLLTEAHKCK